MLAKLATEICIGWIVTGVILDLYKGFNYDWDFVIGAIFGTAFFVVRYKIAGGK